MPSYIKTLFEDENHTNAIYPRTKASAVSDNEGNALGNMATMNAQDVLGGIGTIIPALEMDLLWTNPNPTSDFAGQTLSLDLTNYAMVLVLSNANRTDDKYVSCTSTFVVKGVKAKLLNYEKRFEFRTLNATNSSIVFSDNTNISTYNGSATTDNGWNIPYKIYGIKGVINE